MNNKLITCFFLVSSLPFNLNAQQSWSDLLEEGETTVPSEKYFNLHIGITKAAKRYHLNEEFIAAILMNESAARPCITSSAGAGGLMQLMPETARFLKVRDRFNPRSNIDGGSRYLASLLARSDGNIYMAAAMYNYGPRALHTSINKWPTETVKYVGQFLPRRLKSFKKNRWQAIVPKFIRYTNAHICQFG